MIRKRSAHHLWELIALCALGLALALAVSPALGLSDGAALPPRPTLTSTPVPPPTDTPVPPTPSATGRPIRPPVPTSEPPEPPGVEGTGPAGAEIELRTARAGAWSVVQWQDTAGRWHDVEGWRGTTDVGADGLGIKVWWLSEALFGRGPFRWVLLSAPAGDTTAASAPFYLPGEPGDRLAVTIP